MPSWTERDPGLVTHPDHVVSAVALDGIVDDHDLDFERKIALGGHAAGSRMCHACTGSISSLINFLLSAGEGAKAF